MRLTWVLVVSPAMDRASLICPLDMPWAISMSTSVSRLVSMSSAAGMGGTAGGLRVNSVSSRRVTDGASSASPAATTLTA